MWNWRKLLPRRKLLGEVGEDHACRFLRSKGYKLVARNFRVAYGELDIVALKGDRVCFVEVKTRALDAVTTPLEAIGREKQKRLLRAAKAFLLERGAAGTVDFRFDAVAVWVKPNTARLVRIELFEDLEMEDELYAGKPAWCGAFGA